MFFKSLNNRWRILNFFDSSVNRAPVVAIVCCVLHNYCEMWKFLKIGMCEITRKNNLVVFLNDREMENKQTKKES